MNTPNEIVRELKQGNPLALAAIAAVSLGVSLIVHKYVGTTAAWVVGAPVAVSFLVMLPNIIRAFQTVAWAAYEDVSEWFSSTPDDREESA